jgi:glycosyltransferase involved in cell wall biosynthesis
MFLFTKTIAINCLFWQSSNNEGYGFFVQQIVFQLASNQNTHRFILVFGEETPKDLPNLPNIVALKSGKAPRHAVQFLHWYNIKLPSILKKYKPNLLLQPFGFCSLFIKTPQLLVIHDLAFLHYPNFVAKHHLWFYKTFTSTFIKKAVGVFTVSEFSKHDIIKHYKIPSQKIKVVYSAAKDNFLPLGFNEQQVVKQQFAQGHNYFLVVGGIHPRKNVLTALKAFSLFKKWQQSNFKLIIVGRKAWQYQNFIKSLETYKYKDDVILTDYINTNQLAEITASAYASIYPSFFEGFGVPIIEAMQSGTPIICSNNSSLPEIAGDAALFFDANNATALAEQLIHLYKNEDLRSSLISKGIIQAQQFSWQKTAQLVWKEIEKLM